MTSPSTAIQSASTGPLVAAKPASLSAPLAELEQLVVNRRAEYLAALCDVQAFHGNFSLENPLEQNIDALTKMARGWLPAQKAKLLYEEALGQLRAARDLEAERRNVDAQRRADRMQAMMLVATVASTLVAAAAFVFSLIAYFRPHG
jgi:hypothetical protein